MKERYEYRVVWKRRGLARKSKRFASLKSANRRVLLLGPEPWKAFDRDPDDRFCCSGGPECGCEGMTLREKLLADRNKKGWSDHEDGMPSIEYVRIERRALSSWESLP